ncbi:acyltransferase family protein [Parabacteroides sp.]
MTNDELQSKTIAFLRFPLIVGVVLIHSHITDGVVMNGVTVFSPVDFPVYRAVSNLLSDVFARVAVPLFFFISGFLFFYKSAFSASVYKDKLRKRVRTVLVPYLFWNLVVIGLFFLAQTLMPSLTSGANKPIMDYSALDWLKAFWAKDSPDPDKIGMPIDYPLWFIRDLMMVMLFSPIVYGWVRCLRQYGMIVLGFLWVMGWWIDVPGFSLTAFFFFSFGAFFSVHRRNFVVDMRLLLIPSVGLYAILAVCDLCFMGEPWCRYLHNVGIIVGCVCFISLTATCLERGLCRVSGFLAGSSFFVYAYHGMPLALVIKVVVRYLPPGSELEVIGLYLGSACVVIGIGLVLYGGMRRCVPSFLSLITGGR